MAYQIFNFDSVGNGVRADLSTTDDMYVKAGVIVGREDAVTGNDYTVGGQGSDHSIEVDGRITGGGVAIWLGDGVADNSNSLKIGATGVVQSVGANAIVVNGHSNSFENAGRIEATINGLFLNGPSGSGSTRVENTGTIDVGANAISHVGGTQTVEIFNRGFIRGDSEAIVASGSGVDKVYNTGTIIGAVSLGGGDDLFDGRGGSLNGVVFGEDGNDRLFGDSGADYLVGGDGNDEMRGGRGNDFYLSDVASDLIVELAGQGTDAILSYKSRTLGANIENLELLTNTASFGIGNTLANSITGDSMNNTLRGLAGKDTLLGNKGDDKLTGGIGADKLTGGLGADRFIFNSVAESRAAGGIDKIVDFSRAQKDKIQLDLIDADTTQAGNQAFSFIGTKAFSGKAGELRYAKASSGSIITADLNGDGKADFTVISDVAVNFSKGDFVL
ncbi:MAG TPA: calcium-binding protein [Rhizobiaceae bacterium]|nr:calcium-binding protein [Rhizobiaceae bacterium]